MEEKLNKFYTKTVVKGLRAEQSFFDKLDLVAKMENTNRNELIVRVVKDYLWHIENNMVVDNGNKD